MQRSLSTALALILAGPVVMGLPLIQSPTESTTNRVSLGARVVLRVEATSEISPTLWYQWRSGTGDIPGATNAVLALDGVRTNQAGTYVVSVSDGDGTTIDREWVVLIGPTFTKITNDAFSKGSGAQGIALGDQADYERSPFPRMFDDTPETQIATAVQTVNGDQATLHFQRGSDLKFIRVRGAWRFDFFRTTSARPAQLRQSAETSIPRLTTLARRVRAGEFESSGAAAKALQAQR